MLKHRLSKISKAALLMLLVIGGVFQSCEDVFDEYPYDDGDMPVWLGESVYAFLRGNNSGHTYNYYADIVDKLGETETFSKTGSKTIFVADDAAFERFFENNSWGVRKFEDFTESQLRVILKASMLNDAMLLDMLSAKSSKSEDEGTCLRRTTSLAAIDSIPLVMADEMPKYNKYWDALRGTTRDAQLRIAKDASAPMMVHILTDYLRNKGVTEDDISFLFKKQGKTYKFGEAYIYDKKIVASGVPLTEFSDDTMTIVCQNGYLYRLDDVLIPPSNMAEELRLRDDTDIFSHLIDRYCLPVYDGDLTSEYKRVYNIPEEVLDSVFVLKYYSQNGGLKASDPILDSKDQPNSADVLLFDPGANQNSYGTIGVQEDMAAMLVPDDEAMLVYFGIVEKEGENADGKLILEEYVYSRYPDMQVTNEEELMLALDKVPDNLVAKLVNNLMQRSFVATVPSKFSMITDDANDEMGVTKEHVNECVVANNGVIYILNKVFGPTIYNAVSAPTVILQNMLVMRHVIEQLGYNSYLLAKQARYTLFSPDDEYFVYYDPVSMYSNEISPDNAKAKAYELHYDANHDKKTDRPYLYAKMYDFDTQTYQLLDPEAVTYTPEGQVISMSGDIKNFDFGSGKEFSKFLYNRMTDLLEYLIVVDDVEPGKSYYLSKGGGAVKVTNVMSERPTIQGGEQIERDREITAKTKYSQVNGVAYCTMPAGDGTLLSGKSLYSGVPTPSTRSLYKQLEANQSSFTEFFELLNGTSSAPVQETLTGLFGAANTDSIRAYSVFYTAADNSVYNGVSFLMPYHYTVYLPSDDSINALVSKGLPTWDVIKATAAKSPEKAKSQLRLLNKFIRYHFQDNSLFVDGELGFVDEEGNPESSKKFSTQSIDKGTYMDVEVSYENGTLAVKDGCGSISYVINNYETENKTWNLLSRDFEFEVQDNKDAGVKLPYSILTSSFAVSHSIDGVLKFKSLFGYDGQVLRFANNGEPIEKISVPQNVDGDEKADYIIASSVQSFTSQIEALQGVTFKTAGYLLDSKEEYIKLEGRNILITADGFRVINNGDGTLDFEVDAEGNLLRYSSTGEMIESVPVAGSNE